MELVLKVEMPRVNVAIAVLVHPFEYSVGLLPLVVVSFELVGACDFFSLAVEVVVEEVSLVADARSLVLAQALGAVVVEIAVVD